jgi:membrane protein DedA with SNARE-associated domain
MLKLFEIPIHLLLSYGYPALFMWSILEGEVGLMLAGWLASEQKVFDYTTTIYVAIAGALVGDHLLYFFGRLFATKAKAWLDECGEKRVRVEGWFRRYGALLIVFERFVYGTHLPTLLSIGISEYPYWKFLRYDLLGIVLWAVTFVSIGFYVGNSAFELIVLLQKNALWVIVAIALILLYKKA